MKSNTNNKSVIYSITESAVIAALYAVLTLLLAPISYGAIQFRVAEALNVLPVRKRSAVLGLTVGCAIANAIGVALGLNSCGAADILFGTAATLLSAIAVRLTRNVRIKGIPVLSAIFPAIFNGIIIAAEMKSIYQLPWLPFVLQIGISELLTVLVIGLPLDRALCRVPDYDEDIERKA